MIKYLWSLLRHKLFVFVAGLRVGGIPLWRLLIHDWSKFTPTEFLGYARHDFNSDEPDPAFDYAWLHHIHNGKHHWNHWCFPDGYQPSVLPMPETYVREMVADWMGASRAYTGSWDMTEWLCKNQPRQRPFMHPLTVCCLLEVLDEQGYDIFQLETEVANRL